MRIIPAIDIIEGKCVRLSKGDYNTIKVYDENPLEVAKSYEDCGVEYLHLVDLDGAKSKHIVNYNVLEKLATHTNLKIDFGGGLKSDDDLRIAFNSGASQITGGSVAITHPELFLAWLEKYGSDKIILGADFKDGKIATHGWLQSSNSEVKQFIKDYVSKGVEYTICTDVSKDGMLQGVALDVYKDIIDNINVKLVASGGVACMSDIEAVAEVGCEGVIVGKAIYEGKITLKMLYKFISR